mmetsp:Transcript_32457/g.44487  ORF Transcript_32457/g.44487 Transcript_32457/m.44487 type:complete len:315 (+) Transcript_32457:138-1082(+)
MNDAVSISKLDPSKELEEGKESSDGNLIKVLDVEKTFSTIKWLHFAAFIFMGIQTIAYGAAGRTVNLNIDATVGFPVYCNSAIQSCSAFNKQPNVKNLGSSNPIWLITLFVALASFDHLVSFLYGHYYAASAKEWLFVICSNPFRMIEYSISASIMAVAISILSGISDVHLWFLIFVMNGVGMIIGLVIELIPQSLSASDISGDQVRDTLNSRFESLRKLCCGIGWVVIFTPWLVICCYFFQAAAKSTTMPNFVYAAFLGTLVLFVCFGVNSYLHSIRKAYPFVTAEIVYICLSFTAKTFLAADVFGGLNASTK